MSKKDTVMVELPRAAVENLAKYAGSGLGDPCRAALEAEKVAEREAWEKERDAQLGCWLHGRDEEPFEQQEYHVYSEDGRVVCWTSGGVLKDQVRRAAFVASAPDMARLLERYIEADISDPEDQAPLNSEAIRVLRSNTWLPPEDK